MKVLTVKEAVERVKKGGNLEGIVLEASSTQQVNVQDAMLLSEGGIVIPEQNIYYNDDDIAYDEDIDELTITSGPVRLSWEEKARRAEAHQTTLHLSLDPELKAWLEAQPIPAEQLVEQLLEDFYRAQQLLGKGKKVKG